MKKLTQSLTALLGGLVLGCSSHTYDKTVHKLDRDRFMGSWYVQAGRFTFFEKDPYNAVEIYTWNQKEKRIDIEFYFNQGNFDGPRKDIPQKAWIENEETNAHWKVQPIWPLRFNYLVIALDPNYEWTAIGVPDEKYLWVMSRDPHISRARVESILKELDGMGYSTKDIQYVEHAKK